LSKPYATERSAAIQISPTDEIAVAISNNAGCRSSRREIERCHAASLLSDLKHAGTAAASGRGREGISYPLI